MFQNYIQTSFKKAFKILIKKDDDYSFCKESHMTQNVSFKNKLRIYILII